MLLKYQFGMDHLSVLIVSKICDRSVKIKNNKNNIVLFKDKCLSRRTCITAAWSYKMVCIFLLFDYVEVNGKH